MVQTRSLHRGASSFGGHHTPHNVGNAFGIARLTGSSNIASKDARYLKLIIEQRWRRIAIIKLEQ